MNEAKKKKTFPFSSIEFDNHSNDDEDDDYGDYDADDDDDSHCIQYRI